MSFAPRKFFFFNSQQERLKKPKITLDFFLDCTTINPVDNCIWSAGAWLPLFLFLPPFRQGAFGPQSHVL
jgi:hypothetical protein